MPTLNSLHVVRFSLTRWLAHPHPLDYLSESGTQAGEDESSRTEDDQAAGALGRWLLTGAPATPVGVAPALV